ncbi:universal stress protein [Chryseolinea sp. H1M3-3]|uniref:universal stress protein n=1 Tax=Chryseolinea sp. H1M3-3 TaxID=3034144 RepID=UPI0023EDAD81|nr:universal stress protein [Chryseolinea sp. H1M3-3]
MRKILVPTDLSVIAERGLTLAIEIAERSEAEISLVNFTRHPFGKTFTAMGEVTSKIDQEGELFNLQLLHVTKQKMEDLAAKYRQQGVDIETAIVDEEFKEGIDEYLDRENIDLIVMGTSGEENAKEVFTGNHTEQVIKISKCPVLSVRDGFQIKDFNKIVLAVNVIKNNTHVNEALNTLADLAACFDAHIYLVHVRDRAADYSNLNLQDFFTKMAERAGLRNYSVTIHNADDQANGVIEFAREVKAGLIAVIKNSSDGIFRIFSNHFSDRLVKEVGRPVFTFNLQNVE